MIDWFMVISDLNKSGVSGREIARRLGVSYSNVNAWKNGSSLKYETGAKLIDIWSKETGKCADSLPKICYNK